MKSKDNWLSARELRDRVGLTQRELARAMNKREATISDWERGVSKPLLKLSETLKLTRLLRCSLEDLVKAFDGVDPDVL